MTKLSKAAQKERAALEDLALARDLIYRVHSKLRSDSAAHGLSGQLQAVTIVLHNVSESINRRTTP